MPFIMNSEAQLTFFTKVFGPGNVTVKVEHLINAGVKFETGLYSVSAEFKGSVFQPVKLPVGITALMKGTAGHTETVQSKNLVTTWVNDLYNEVNAGAALTVITTPTTVVPTSGATKVVMTGIEPGFNLLLLIKRVNELKSYPSLTAVKLAVEAVKNGQKDIDFGTFISLEAANIAGQKLKAAGGIVELIAFSGQAVQAPKTTLKAQGLVNAVIDLRNAVALGQKVHGTSSGSVYHTIALNDRIKLAARIYKTGSISIRAEWVDGTPQNELTLLKDSGVTFKSNYGSIHFDANNVPLQRVIGAFVIGTGIKWNAAVINGDELVISESV